MFKKSLFPNGGVKLRIMGLLGARKQRLWEKNFTSTPKELCLVIKVAYNVVRIPIYQGLRISLG